MFELTLQPSFKLWLSNSKGDYVIGKGGANLLKAIDETHSLVKATELLPKKISYRKAWGMLQKIKQNIGGLSPVEASAGGKGGGGKTILTEAGKNLLETYLEFERIMDQANKRFQKKMKEK
ncbi:MAG: ModE family transcriptional regulator [Candidatus Lokiarchaeota archaeon]|nr:ModE family transcriptional regulator [Candidatus Lokiarchaeota archaeon]